MVPTHQGEVTEQLRTGLAAVVMAGALMVGAFAAPASASVVGTQTDDRVTIQQRHEDDKIHVDLWKKEHNKGRRVEHHDHKDHHWAAKYAEQWCKVDYHWARDRARTPDEQDAHRWYDVCNHKHHGTWYKVRYKDNQH